MSEPSADSETTDAAHGGSGGKPAFISRSVLVTGGNRGIGLAIARRLAADGHKVAVTHRGSGVPDGLFGVQCDVTDTESVNRAVAEVAEHKGPVEVVVANAGVTEDTLLMRMDVDQFERVVNANLTGAFRVTKAATRNMLKNRWGRFIYLGSVVALMGTPGQANYASSKAGVIGFTKTWSRELGRKGVRVNAVAPGFIATPILATIPDNVLKEMETRVPLKRLGQPEEIANVYAFLASDEASYINGAVIEVSGGMTV